MVRNVAHPNPDRNSISDTANQLRLKFLLFGWIMQRKFEKVFIKETLGDLIKKSKATS
jgi:hypothetical protein